MSKQNFYDVFKFGWEIECETKSKAKTAVSEDISVDEDLDDEELEELPEEMKKNRRMLLITHDGSINRRNDGSCQEIITAHPVKSEAEEKLFIKEMKEAFPEFESKSGEKIFAYFNNSCGTHFHFSFKNHKDNYLWLFHTIDFEKFFMKKYLQTFKSEKFLSRLNNSYCKANHAKSARGSGTIPQEVMKDIRQLKTEDFKNFERGDRYQWLNMQSVLDGTGAEIRIFPFIQTYKGLDTLLKFMKDLLIEYYELPSTQQKIKLLEIFENKLVPSGINVNRLSELKRIVYKYLINGREDGDLQELASIMPGEFRILLAKWASKCPSLIKVSETI